MTDANPADEVNPYQSPLAEAGPVEPLPPYLLTEPVEMEGIKSIEDTLRAVRAIGGQVTWKTHLVLVIGTVFVCGVVASLLLPERLVVIVGGVSSLSLILLYFYTFVYRAPRNMRKRLEATIGSGQFEKYRFTEYGISYEMPWSRGELSWDRFSSYLETDGLLLLPLLEYSDMYVIPRTFCQRDEDWQDAINLLASKMPVWNPSKPLAYRQTTGEAWAALVESTEIAEPDTIKASGRLRPAQVRQSLRMATDSWFSRHFFWVANACFLVLIALAWQVDYSIGRVIPFVVGQFFLLAIVWHLHRNEHKNWQQQRGPYELQNWVITADELRVTTPTAAIVFPWKAFDRLILQKNLATLVLTNRTFLPLPRSYFRTADDWNRFLERAEEQVSSKSA